MEYREGLDYVDMAVPNRPSGQTEKKPGDILVFMPTEQDILETCERLEGRKYSGTAILPLYARLPGTQQGKVYHVKGPKIVVATNVAETSLTIPGIPLCCRHGFGPYIPISTGNSNQQPAHKPHLAEQCRPKKRPVRSCAAWGLYPPILGKGI